MFSNNLIDYIFLYYVLIASDNFLQDLSDGEHTAMIECQYNIVYC